jgi:hypothetical protein
MWELGWLHPATDAGIEHPPRNLQSREPFVLIVHALQNNPVASACLATNQHTLPMPRVPAILYFSKTSFMGVAYLGCTIRDDPMRAWDQAFRIPTAGRAQASIGMSCQPMARIRAQDVLGGLHHEYWLEEIAA